MEITLLQIVLVFIVACIAGMESVLDEFQFHRPLVACTSVSYTHLKRAGSPQQKRD